MPTTAPSDPGLLDRLMAVPPVGWLLIAALVAGLVRWMQLRIAMAGGPDESVARDQMTDLYIRLKRAGFDSGESFYAIREGAANAGFTVRAEASPPPDPRMMILHDDAPRRPLAAFPRLTHGRLVLFATGRIVLVSESAFEKLIEADDALRDARGD